MSVTPHATICSEGETRKPHTCTWPVNRLAVISQLILAKERIEGISMKSSRCVNVRDAELWNSVGDCSYSYVFLLHNGTVDVFCYCEGRQ